MFDHENVTRALVKLAGTNAGSCCPHHGAISGATQHGSNTKWQLPGRHPQPRGASPLVQSLWPRCSAHLTAKEQPPEALDSNVLYFP